MCVCVCVRVCLVSSLTDDAPPTSVSACRADRFRVRYPYNASFSFTQQMLDANRHVLLLESSVEDQFPPKSDLPPKYNLPPKHNLPPKSDLPPKHNFPPKKSSNNLSPSASINSPSSINPHPHPLPILECARKKYKFANLDEPVHGALQPVSTHSLAARLLVVDSQVGWRDVVLWMLVSKESSQRVRWALHSW